MAESTSQYLTDECHACASAYATLGAVRRQEIWGRNLKTLLPNDPQLLAEFAAILAIANGGDLSGKPTQILRIALKLDPNHRRSLALCAIAAFNDRDYAAAIDYWERLQKTFPPGSENARKVAARIEEARAAALSNLPAAAPPARLQ